MPVNSTHPDYDATLPAWLRARDVIAGEDAVKAAGERYLPRLDIQSNQEYAAYWDLFFSALDIKSGWGGPSPWKYWTNPVDRKAHGDIDLTAWYLQQFAKAE